MAFVPPTGVETTVARGLLPATVPHADAAANSGRAALLVAAMASQPEHLLAATRDWLHQEYRKPAMPRSAELMTQLRSSGLAAVISGAGPTVLVLGSEKTLDDATAGGWVAAAEGFGIRRGRVGGGARVVTSRTEE